MHYKMNRAMSLLVLIALTHAVFGQDTLLPSLGGSLDVDTEAVEQMVDNAHDTFVTESSCVDEYGNSHIHGEFYGKVGICEKYFQCVYGSEIEVMCPDDTAFDAGILVCNYIDLVRGCEHLNGISCTDIHCRDEAGFTTTKYQDPFDCQAYQCSNGYSYEFNCAPPLVFNPQQGGYCDYQENFEVCSPSGANTCPGADTFMNGMKTTVTTTTTTAEKATTTTTAEATTTTTTTTQPPPPTTTTEAEVPETTTAAAPATTTAEETTTETTTATETTTTATAPAVPCPPLSPPVDGSMAYVDIAPRNQKDSIIEFSCNEGFELEGRLAVACLSDGTWSEQAPTCAPTLCGKCCYTTEAPKEEQFMSCKAIKESQSNAVSGMYELVSESGETFTTFCDMETSDGGWTLVASVHENDMDGKCTEGDRWSSEVGVVERHGGETLWENDEVYGTADQAASDDYKNSAYFELQAEQLMVIQVPNDSPSEEFISSASFQYTTDAFLQEFGGNLQGLFKQYPIIDRFYEDKKDDGPSVRIDFVKGSEREAFKQYGYDMQQEMQSGYMQFRAVNKEHGATAFCPYGRMKGGWGSSSTEHGCFGATMADVSACGDFSAFDGIFNDMGFSNNWATDKEMRRSAFLILYR